MEEELWDGGVGGVGEDIAFGGGAFIVRGRWSTFLWRAGDYVGTNF